MSVFEISHASGFDQVIISINGVAQLQAQSVTTAQSIIECDVANIQVQFWPFKIKPLVRYNGFLLDYWLANVALQDHQLHLSIDSNFYQLYHAKDLQGRANYLTQEQKQSDHYYDKYIGVNNLYPDLLQEIKQLIS
jgi:hypothetical protein